MKTQVFIKDITFIDDFTSMHIKQTCKTPVFANTPNTPSNTFHHLNSSFVNQPNYSIALMKSGSASENTMLWMSTVWIHNFVKRESEDCWNVLLEFELFSRGFKDLLLAICCCIAALLLLLLEASALLHSGL